MELQELEKLASKTLNTARTTNIKDVCIFHLSYIGDDKCIVGTSEPNYKTRNDSGYMHIIENGKSVKRSKRLPSGVHTTIPFDEHIFISCHNGEAYITDESLEILKDLGKLTTGTYHGFYDNEKKEIVLASRDGAVCYHDVKSGDTRKIQVAKEGVRAWSLAQEPDTKDLLVGSYDGEIVLISPERKILNRKKIGGASVWTTFHNGKNFIVGDFTGNLYEFSNDLEKCENLGKMHALTGGMAIDDDISILGDYFGGLHLFSTKKRWDIEFYHDAGNASVFGGLDYDERARRLIVGFANGNIATFQIPK